MLKKRKGVTGEGIWYSDWEVSHMAVPSLSPFSSADLARHWSAPWDVAVIAQDLVPVTYMRVSIWDSELLTLAQL